jgi:hypothetical protein
MIVNLEYITKPNLITFDKEHPFLYWTVVYEDGTCP